MQHLHKYYSWNSFFMKVPHSLPILIAIMLNFHVMCTYAERSPFRDVRVRYHDCATCIRAQRQLTYSPYEFTGLQVLSRAIPHLISPGILTSRPNISIFGVNFVEALGVAQNAAARQPRFKSQFACSLFR